MNINELLNGQETPLRKPPPEWGAGASHWKIGSKSLPGEGRTHLKFLKLQVWPDGEPNSGSIRPGRRWRPVQFAQDLVGWGQEPTGDFEQGGDMILKLPKVLFYNMWGLWAQKQSLFRKPLERSTGAVTALGWNSQPRDENRGRTSHSVS